MSESYRYDVIDQLLRSTSGAAIEIFSYDAVGNRLLGPSRSKDASYEHDAANRMLRGRQYLYSYDDNGNQVSKTLPGDSSKGWTYTWDYENRLVRAERTGEGGARTVSFKYDPFGRRIEKSMTVIVNDLTKVVTWHYVYDELDIAIEVKNDGANTSVTSYDHGPGTDDHLALERDGRFYYYHADGLGSIVSISDNDRRVVQSYTYESYGMLKPSTNFENCYTYTGREWDNETGLYYYRARYYDQIEGRFIARDPIGLDGGDVNFYRYVMNNPLTFTDPSGEFLRYGNYCGPGHSAGLPIDELDALCEAHDRCYAAEGFCWKDVIQPPRDGDKFNKQHKCDVALREGARKVVPTNSKQKNARKWVLRIF